MNSLYTRSEEQLEQVVTVSVLESSLENCSYLVFKGFI